MPLKDRISADISRVFLNGDHFAEEHYWNGKKLVCVCDDEAATWKMRAMSEVISWSPNTRRVVLYVEAEKFPDGEKPEPDTAVMLDRTPMRVLSVEENLGMLSILLESKDGREFV